MSASYRFFPAKVVRITDLTPSFRRFTFGGSALADFADPGMDQRIKLVLPGPGAGLATMPTGADWHQRWSALDPEERPTIRTYTTRRVRPERCEVDLDMVVHEALGPAARWIAEAKVGAEVLLLGPVGVGGKLGAGFIPPKRVGQYLLAGDETAAPAISVILEQLPRSAGGVVVLELPAAADRDYLPSHPGFDQQIITRSGEARRNRGLVRKVATVTPSLFAAGSGTPVEEIDLDHELLWEVPRAPRGGAALRSAPLYAWLAGEASGIKTLRRQLVGEAGLDRRAVAFMGYWRKGRPEGG